MSCGSIVALCLSLLAWHTSLVVGVSDPGYHCNQIDPPVVAVEQCVSCFFPQNCLANSTCLVGTTGDTCEKCIKKGDNVTDDAQSKVDYHRIGNQCTSCTKIPWSAVAFGVYLLMVCFTAGYNGFTKSVCTKLKQVSRFLQLLILVLHIKVAWPDLLTQTMAVLNFASFNSNIVNPGCLFHLSISLHFMEWAVSLCVPTFVIAVVLLIDKRMKNSADEKSDEVRRQRWERRSKLRRFCWLVFVAMYQPLTLSCIHAIICSDTIPRHMVLSTAKDVFLYDNSILCDTLLFQMLSSLCTAYLLIFIIVTPIFMIFFMLRQRKWNLLQPEMLRYGAIYESYTRTFCFWEAIPMLRTFVTVVITDTYPFSPIIQCIVQMSLTGVYLFLILAGRPFTRANWRVCKWLNIHLLFEVLYNVCIATMQASALLITMAVYQPELEYVLVTLISVLLLAFFIQLLAVPLEEKTDEESCYDLPPEDEGNKPKFAFWRRNKVGEEITGADLEDRKRNVAF